MWWCRSIIVRDHGDVYCVQHHSERREIERWQGHRFVSNNRMIALQISSFLAPIGAYKTGQRRCLTVWSPVDLGGAVRSEAFDASAIEGERSAKPARSTGRGSANEEPRVARGWSRRSHGIRACSASGSREPQGKKKARCECSEPFKRLGQS